MAQFNTIDDLDLDGKVVLTRVDVNVPVEDGRVTDATRIEKIVPTVKDIQAAGGIPVLLAHFDRPKGKRVDSMSLKQILPALEAALGQPVVFAEDCIGGAAKRTVAALEKGQVALLENTRFHEGEEANDPTFAASMAALGSVYVNDAFSAAHRAHASTEGLAKLLHAGAGRLMEAELKALDAALGDPQRPVMAVVGGAKVSTKLELLTNLIEKVDHLVIGGGMANTFLVAKGVEVGKSLAERDMADTARAIIEKAEAGGCTIHLPVDIVVAREFKAGAASETLPVDECPSDAMILDAGPDTVEALRQAMTACRTLIWNGPLGAFEIEPFDAATNAAAQAAGELTRQDQLVSVAGGGDTVAALNKAGVAEQFTFISTAGGAFLEWMEGKELPGVAALEASKH
ncbi:phosphoglycerate kinase [Paracoccus sp. 1_MG-2023]|uniref:phosphoglycerate kinase n=1 Tax=unclassified Paracoccus (in: a-proteobacteria) TaxID=2688777 RepID=UPI001C09B7E4|nr:MULTISPECIES: phosphoglycerate kinase [unclassified Paracoccus (in: a-proteobacteria)]MBU2956711.1 phosphoglycerate kinase [Paracoccus sp. C2R09]MDO6669249.1 phosphoglycerate kinase [Paracoccus sp. 1_MG-2023]